tara:strand:+ start:53 stop:310 length:258 start_codon:yes stop_codon:yes gene_type:complete
MKGEVPETTPVPIVPKKDSAADSQFEILYKVTSAICYQVEAPSRDLAMRLFKEEEDISSYTIDSIMDSPLDMDDIEIIEVKRLPF